MDKRISYILYGVLAVVLVVVLSAWYIDSQKAKPVLVKQSAMTKPAELAQAIKVTPKQAEKIAQIVPKSEPVASYTVQAPNVAQAAKLTSKMIEQKAPDLPKVATEKSDRTVIVPNEERQKVDVYKIDLEKNHKIKAGMTYINDKLYPAVGYQAGRFEGVVHFDNAKVKGATVLYTVAEW